MALAGIDELLIGIDETVRMTLINPFNGSPCINRDTEENGWIDVMSDTSDAGAAYTRARNNRVLARGGRAATDEELQFENVEKAAALVTGWTSGRAERLTDQPRVVARHGAGIVRQSQGSLDA